MVEYPKYIYSDYIFWIFRSMRRICKWEDREEAAVIAQGAVAAAIQYQDQAEDTV